MDKADKELVENVIGHKINQNLEIAIERAEAFLADYDMEKDEIDKYADLLNPLTFMEFRLLTIESQLMREVSNRLYKPLSPAKLPSSKREREQIIQNIEYLQDHFGFCHQYWRLKGPQILTPKGIGHAEIINDLLTDIKCMKKYVETGKLTRRDVAMMRYTDLSSAEEVSEQNSLKR